MTESKTDIRLFNLGQLQAQLGKYNWPKFRAKQIYHWLWKKHVRSFGEMNNLPKDIIEGLENNFEILPIRVKDEQVSDDGTIKSAFETADKKIVEGVLIPTEKRIKSLVTPVATCDASLSCWCVVLAGCMIKDLVSPMLASNENSFVVSAIVFAASKPPFTPNVTIPLCPLGKYLSASSL
jgi:hypothetical protein